MRIFINFEDLHKHITNHNYLKRTLAMNHLLGIDSGRCHLLLDTHNKIIKQENSFLIWVLSTHEDLKLNLEIHVTVESL